MGKLTSKLRKHENNSDILLYQIYLPKFHVNILKYYRLNIFKEIVISFKKDLQNLRYAFSTVSLFKLVDVTFILIFSSSFVLRGVLLVCLSNTPHAW